MGEKKNTAAFTGPRPENLMLTTEAYEKVRVLLRRRILKAFDRGYCTFISGGARGIDLLAAEEILGVKKQGYDITLEIAVPFIGQENRWPAEDQHEYRQILKAADKVNVLFDKASTKALLDRNRYMIERSNLIIAVYDGVSGGGTGYTYKKALEAGVEVVRINPKDMTVTGYNIDIPKKE